MTYTALDGRVLDLSRLTDSERTYLERCVTVYHQGTAWETFSRLVEGTDNPVVAAAGGRVTRAVWDHPLFQVVRDLEDRLGIAQGEVGLAPDDRPDRDPFADEWISSVEAAHRKGVTLPGLRKAVERGDLIARPAKPGGMRLVISLNSLQSWTPNPARQAARQKVKPGQVLTGL